MSHDGSNVCDIGAWQVERRIRAADREATDEAIAAMREATDRLIAAYLSKDEFRIMRESEAADGARLRLISLMGFQT